MPAPKGNRFWETRSSHGRKPIFSTANDMWQAACEYFEWVEDNPLWESKVSQYQGEPVEMPMPKMRAMTIDGLLLFLDISDTTWYNYCEKEDFVGITRKIENVIRSQKFAGAAADLLNANIIARDLGLKDASTNEHTGPSGGPVDHKWTVEFVNATTEG